MITVNVNKELLLENYKNVWGAITNADPAVNNEHNKGLFGRILQHTIDGAAKNTDAAVHKESVETAASDATAGL